MQLDRRAFLKFAAAAGAAAAIPRKLFAGPATQGATTVTPPAATQPMLAAPRRVQIVRFPEKTDLILLTDRPPQLETPLRYFKSDLTPNDAFFVRWHLSGIPTSVDTQKFTMVVKGHVDKPEAFTLANL